MAIDIAGQQVLANPVGSFLQGRALQRAEVQQAQQSQVVQEQLAGAQQNRKQSAIEFSQQQEIAQNRQNYLLASAAASSDDPAGLIRQVKPEFIKDWDSHHGEGSFDSLKPADLKKVAQHMQADFASKAGIQMPTKLQDVRDASGALLQVDPATGKKTQVVAPQKPDYEPAKIKETARHDKAMEDAANNKKDTVPSGYEPDPATPGALRPIAGGPHDPNQTTGLGGRDSVMFNRVASSANSAVAAIKNIAELPITTSTGWFGGSEQGKGLFAAAKSVLAQKVTGQEAQDLKTMIAGVSRNLATIESAGLAPNGSLTHSMDSITINEGDTQMTKLRKMAEMRQIVSEGIRPRLSDPKVPTEQKNLINGIIAEVEKAVPFTQHDITKLQQSKDPKATIMDFAKSSGLGEPKHPPEIQSLLDKYK